MPGSPESNQPNQEWRAPPRPQPDQQANPLTPLLQEQRGGRERSHEELVAVIRKDMAAYVAERKPYQFDPVAWMRGRLVNALTNLELAENPHHDTNAPRWERPHAQMMMAWDVISQPYYKSAYYRGLAEGAVKHDARHLGHAITLDPNEGMLLAAMAEAVGIPNPFGQRTQEKRAST